MPSTSKKIVKSFAVNANFQTRLAASCLNAGGVISNPTDTIQSLTCLPRFEHSIQKIIQLKQRPNAKGFILLASDIHYFMNFVANSENLKLIKNTKIPTTYLLKAKQKSLLTGEFDTIALRLTSHPLIAYLCCATNSALVSTSANLSGRRSATGIVDLKRYFADKLDFIITPQNYNNKPSQIIELQTGKRLR